MRIAVLDDWQHIAEEYADWSQLRDRAEIVFFHEPFAGEDDAASALREFDIILTMRERTPFPSSLVDSLPNLKMFGMTGSRAKAIDIAGMLERGITVSYTQGGESGTDTAELTLALMMAAARQVPAGDANIRQGRFQHGIRPGLGLAGRTIGLVGLGRIGKLMAGYANALGMNVVAWSRNLTPERAEAAGATAVSREDVFASADVVSIHVYLSPETEGLVTKDDIGRMKPGAILVNTSRAPLIDQAALLEAVQSGRITAALDVYGKEPLPLNDPLRHAPNTVLTPHIGYGTSDVMETFYRQTVENTLAFLDGKPIRTHQPAASSAAAG
ncbi:D-2-hydroxyacid dehydrogenase family protein [Microbaculum marinum]|uniref:D-2-hydroxyacid dehydrogenase family protein n=1 Tax=Microbaculum marinum TaxID=1764581 RepID=A0AAW9RQ71_9HYPH